MPRQRSPSRSKAEEIYLNSKGTKKLIDIAAELGVKDSQIRKWKSEDKWDDKLKGALPNRKSNVTKKRGAPKGNKNAVGNSGGAAPLENKNAEKHGFFSKHLPEDTLEIMQEIEMKAPLDILWDQIMLQYTAIIRAQRIMYVTDKDEMIKELKKIKSEKQKSNDPDEEPFESYREEEWEFQFAWDRQATFLNAQSRAISELRSLVKTYLELEGIEKDKSKAGVQDWKTAIQEIANRRKQQQEVKPDE